jgi:hypothetical protein
MFTAIIPARGKTMFQYFVNAFRFVIKVNTQSPSVRRMAMQGVCAVRSAPNAKAKPIAALIGLGFVLALVSGTATADYNQCGRGNFCAWDNYNGVSPFLFFHDWHDSNWHNDVPPDGSGGISADRAQSVRNNGYSGPYQDVIFWEHPNFSGYGYCSEVGEYYDYLGYWDNRISSHEWVHDCDEGVTYYRQPAAATGETPEELMAPAFIELPSRDEGE